MLRKFALTIMLCLTPLTAAAAERGTADDAMIMVTEAIELFETSGRDALLSAISDPENTQFHYLDLFVLVWDAEGVLIGHGLNSPLVGQNTLHITDVDGVPFIEMSLSTALELGGGWVSYRWEDPITKEIAEKSTYVLPLDDNMIVGVGIYAG